MGIGSITSIGKQNVGGNQNNLKMKYIKYNIASLVDDKIGVLVNDSVTDRETLIDYMAQNGALAHYVYNGSITGQYRSIICSYTHYRSNRLTPYSIVAIHRSFNSETQEWGSWSNPNFYCLRDGTYDFEISGDFDVID